MPTNPIFIHGIDKLCTICHVILTDADSTTHSIFSTIVGLESPMNVLQVLQSFSNFNFYNGPQMVCTTCYDKTAEVYKFIQMCNKAHENMQHYLKNEEANVDVKIEEFEMISVTEIKVEETILQERMEKEETCNEEITIFHTEKVTEEKTDSSHFDNLNDEIIDEKLYDERMGLIKSKDYHLVFSDQKELDDHRQEGKRELSNALFEGKYKLRSRDQSHNAKRAHISKDLLLNQNRDQPLKYHETDLVCLECQQVFCNDKQLKIHMRRSHKKKSRLNTHIQVDTDEKRGFATSSSLRRYTASHNEVQLKAHKCAQCDRRFAHPSGLRNHMNIHNGIKAHKCAQCDRRFTHPSGLRNHMDIHNEVKTHKCEQCDRRFTQASNLRRHMDSHNEVKAYTCEQCDRRFTDPSVLRRHMNIHNGVKAHKCEQCDRRFTRAETLRSHMEIHNGVKAHKCEYCDRRFTLLSYLRKHMGIHNGVKPHQCEQCDRRFNRPSNLRRHMEIHN